ncbi:hypothetical protein BV25DRAFT_1819618 [Artomyces pyxidatus]|uniref:Uncharacterized protein n=1 Tax=Artomyces pyxidatus TaxID=48021 RepID=A0ACB8TFR1_9AGAM|nr:hypothetical protein BV25DRAFT_1819618 [Artomyces pyxidatus]
MSFATSSAAFGMQSGQGQAVANPNNPSGQPGQTQPPLFGQPQQNQSAPSLFGGLGQNQQQSSSGFLGQAPANSQAAPAPSNPFLTTGANQTQQSGSWNSSNPLLPKSAFGAPNPGTSNAAGPSGLFQQAPSNTGLGNSFLGQQSQQPTGFGTSFLGQSQQPNTGLSFFGNQQKPQSGFGLSNAQTPQQSTQAVGPVPFTKSTKFNDLPDNVRKVFEDIEAHVQGRVQISNDLKQRKVGEESTKGQDLIRGVHKDLINAITVLQNDVLSTRDIRAKVDQSVQDTIVATHIIDGFRNPQQHGAYLRNHATFPLEFFTRITEQMRRRLQWYKATIEQIERKLASTAQQAQYTPQVISTTLEAQHASFIALANKTAALDADLQKLKVLYTQLWRAKTGSMRDPFNELDRGTGGEFGLDGLYTQK